MAYSLPMSKVTSVELNGVGVCVTSQDGVVKSQNETCTKICGQQLGNKCDFGCGIHIAASEAGRDIDLGVRTFRNIMPEGMRINVALINDGTNITSLLFDVTDLVKKQIAQVEKYNLSKTEIKVLELYLQGYTNAETAKKLFICRTTLRTHLNNIYKKLPAELKERILSSHLNTSA